MFGRSAGLFLGPIAQNGPFWAQKCCFWAQNPFFVGILQIFCYYHDWAPKRQCFHVYHNAGQAPGGCKDMFLAQNWPQNQICLRYTHITYLFWAQTDSTQWDHKSPISGGNSEYLWFSGRWPFDRLAGRFVAPIAQSGPFGVQKCCFWPKTKFFVQKKRILGQKTDFWPEILRFFTLPP